MLPRLSFRIMLNKTYIYIRPSSTEEEVEVESVGKVCMRSGTLLIPLKWIDKLTIMHGQRSVRRSHVRPCGVREGKAPVIHRIQLTCVCVYTSN